MRRDGRNALVLAAGPKVLMAVSLAAFVVATTVLLAVGASGAVVVIVGVAVLVACAISCLWAWSLGARQSRFVAQAMRDLSKERGAGNQRSDS